MHTVHGRTCRCPQFPRELQGGLDNEWNKNDGSQVSEVHKFYSNTGEFRGVETDYWRDSWSSVATEIRGSQGGL